MMIVGNPKVNAPMYGLVFTNNLVITGPHPIWNADKDRGDCAQSDVPLIIMNKCFTSFTFSNNALIASPAAFPPSTWPKNNMFPQTVEQVLFDNATQGNYALQSTSPYKGIGTDGKDLGADIAGLATALANVE
jgi:hypothetical protein